MSTCEACKIQAETSSTRSFERMRNISWLNGACPHYCAFVQCAYGVGSKAGPVYFAMKYFIRPERRVSIETPVHISHVQSPRGAAVTKV